MKKLLVSFANERFYRSQQILVDSAKKYFDGHASFTPDSLDETFKEKNKQILGLKRGCGYWIWKPYILKTVLSKLNDGDGVLYIDSGNLIINDPSVLFSIAKRDLRGILLFENRDGNPTGDVWKNSQWVKADCFNLMKCNTDEYKNGIQVDGSYGVYIKTDFCMTFLDEYLSYCQDSRIVTDEPNTTGENCSDFKDHRHDQSILSLLAIKYMLPIAREPSEWGNHVITATSEYPQLFQHHRGLV